MIVSCPHCRAKNRLRAERFDDEPTCGSCGKALPAAQFEQWLATALR